jgi:hypothetical protein
MPDEMAINTRKGDEREKEREREREKKRKNDTLWMESFY